MAKQCVQALVSGRVQGVWYRQSTKQQALAHHVTGWAKNLPDGRVEVRLCGEPKDVAVVLSWLAEGPDMARVDGVVSSEVECVDIVGFSTL